MIVSVTPHPFCSSVIADILTNGICDVSCHTGLAMYTEGSSMHLSSRRPFNVNSRGDFPYLKMRYRK